MAYGPSRSAACGIFPDQGSNPCPLHWQADSQPLRHQGSPRLSVFIPMFSGFYTALGLIRFSPLVPKYNLKGKKKYSEGIDLMS